jgi:hypothetical protein
MWAQLLAEQSAIKDAIAAGKPIPPGMDNRALVNAALFGGGGIPRLDRSEAEDQQYYSTLAAMDYLTQQAMIAAKGPISNDERRKILVEMMVDGAYTDRDYIYKDSDYDAQEYLSVVTMTAAQRKIGFLPIADARKKGGYIDPETGIPMTIENYLRAAAKRGDFGGKVEGTISDDDIERAYFALERLSRIMSPAEANAEILKRLRGE